MAERGTGREPGATRSEYPPADANAKDLNKKLFQAQRELEQGNAQRDAKKIADAQQKLVDISNALISKGGPLDRADAQQISDLVAALSRANQQSSDASSESRNPGAVDRSRAKEIGDALDGLTRKGYRDGWPHDQGGQPCWCGKYGMHGGQSR